jgi:Domain of unknown function (DUF4214)
VKREPLLFEGFSMKNTVSRRRSRTTFRPQFELLETRLTPTIFTVSSLADSGDGSLRAAITSVNAGTANEIDFSVAGVIQLTSGPLPAIGTGVVMIDGRTAPGFAGAPVVEIDNNGFAGLTFNDANDPTVVALSIVNAKGPGVTLQGEGFPGITGGTFVGNYIGLALDGSVAGNTGPGLFADDYAGVTIGGTNPADRNVISGNGGDGIQLGSIAVVHGNYTTIEGNFIGTDPTGHSARANQGNGITVFSSGNNTIGGTTAGAANTIAFNSQSGVVIDGAIGLEDGAESFNTILNNSIFNNGFKGIVLQNSGNQNIPAPQLNFAVESPGSMTGSFQLQLGGVLNATPNVQYLIQVFATLNGVPAGQGQLFLGSMQVTTDANGFAAFTLSSVSVPAGAGTTFTATTTSTAPFKLESTSAFSNSIGSSTPNQTPNQNFVTTAYGFLLHRAPDPSSTFWVNQLDGGAAAARVLLDIQGSTEYLSDQVAAMYRLYLNREPDTGGAQHWTSFLQAGGTLEELAAELTSSEEYFVLQGGTNQGFVLGLYKDVLNRTPSIADLAGWEAALAAGASRLEVAGSFLTSQEYRTDLVQSDYVTYLLRAADSGGLTAWVDALNAGATDQQVLAQIFGSPEGYQLWS